MLRISAAAAIVIAGCTTPAAGSELVPPAEFDRPFAGQLFEIAVPAADVPAACDQVALAYGAPRQPLLAGHTLLGCSTLAPTGPATCTIVVSDGPDAAAIRRHEIAHCNGWRH